MTRIIGGRLSGRRLRTPASDGTRPTSDRVREALFSALESRRGTLAGLRVLDLYAGSGALGLESWSRGAVEVTLVERDRRTAGVIRGNVRELGCDVAEVVTGSVPTVLARGSDVPYDVVLSDPPYPVGTDAIVRDLTLLAEHGWLADRATVLVERGSRAEPLTWPDGYEPDGERRYGETMLWWGVWYGPDAGTPPS